MQCTRRKMSTYSCPEARFRLGTGAPRPSGRREAPIEREELLRHGRETEPFGALARPAPHFVSGGNIQAGEPIGNRADLESVDDLAVHAFLDSLRPAAQPSCNQREAAGHPLDRRIRKRVVHAEPPEGDSPAVPGTTD